MKVLGNPHVKEFVRYFPELSMTDISLEDVETLDVEFVISSVIAGPELEYYLTLCNQSDLRVVSILQKFASNIHRKNNPLPYISQSGTRDGRIQSINKELHAIRLESPSEEKTNR